MMTRQRDRSESGAAAVLVSILVITVFIPLAALAVDLGNAWARGRAVQRQADLSAIGAGYLLPMSAASGHTSADIAGKVAELLNGNLAAGQDPSNVSNPVSATQLLNGSVSDGEVQFFEDDDTATPCTDKCPVMRVVAPPARVEFAFAVALSGGGASSTEVQREAVVKAVSPLPDPRHVLPFWLPNGCGYGAAQADVSNGNGAQGGPQEPLVGVLPGGQVLVATGAYAPSPLDPNVVLTGSPGFLTSDAASIDLTKWQLNAPTNYADNATIVVYDAAGTRVATYASARPATKPQTGSWSPTEGTIKAADLGNLPGQYTAYLEIKDNQDKRAYSSTGISITVSGVTPSASPTPTAAATATATPTATPTTPTASSSTDVGCLGADRGNFGQLNSPRVGVTGRQDRLGLNIAAGLDHQIGPFVWSSTQTPVKDCGKKTSPIPGAYQDTDSVSSPPRNCIQGDTGNDGPTLYDGFVGGVNGIPGRIDASNGTTRCAGKRTDQTVNGEQLNNDTLSCYLRNGHTLFDIAQSTGVDSTMLDPAVLDSPRFVWLPVVVATDRAQKDYQPIYDFVPAFVTDEATTSTSDPALFTSTHTINGLEMNNGNSVKVLHIFVFNKAALALDEQSPVTDYLAQLGQTEVRLIG